MGRNSKGARRQGQGSSRAAARGAGAALLALATIAGNEWAEYEAPPERTPEGQVNLNGLWRGPRALPETPAEYEESGIPASFPHPAGKTVLEPLRRRPGPGVSALSNGAARRLTRRDTARAERTEADSWTDRNSWERCLTRGIPAGMLPEAHADRWRIVQTVKTVAIVAETLQEARIARFGEERRKRPRQWLGQRTARWDGDTLIIESHSFRIDTDEVGDSDPLRGAHPGSNEGLRTTERWKALTREEIEYSIEVHDALTYNEEVLYAYTWRREPEGQVSYEDACHEGNRSMANTLRGARRDPRTSRADNRKKVEERKRHGHPGIAWPATRFVR